MTPNIAIVHIENPHWRGIPTLVAALPVVDPHDSVVTAHSAGCARCVFSRAY